MLGIQNIHKSRDSRTNMEPINLTLLCVKWYQKKTGLRTYFHFNFSKLHLKITKYPPVQWINSIPDDGSEHTITRSVQVSCAPNVSKRDTTVQVQGTSQSQRRIEITQGQILVNQSFASSVMLKLHNGAQINFYPSMKIQPNPPVASQASNRKSCPYSTSSSATIRSFEGEYKGRFTFCLKLYGEVLCTYEDDDGLEYTDQAGIVDIISDLQSWGRRGAEALTVCSDGVIWRVEGEADLPTNSSFDITWRLA
ncbi:uncharacterized protein LOC131935819 isoform X2 [Physella acuta]|uniref:uncharacterized protein LOC131935819 isoform X2 n=1 Tax=Physella acuta TaxID=109671 RepID=UPI0027DD9932|nr:uncharacterized protein LOC131935819 isoform X2 [Physella acuta]